MSGIIGADGVQRERCGCGKFFRLVDEIYEKKTEQLPYGSSMCMECFNIRLNELINEAGHDPWAPPQQSILDKFEIPNSIQFHSNPELQ